MELLEVEKEIICGKKVTVFTIHGDDDPQKYLIGVQVSKILHRQTFNLYRSLKLKGVGVVRASPQQVGFLLRTQSLPPNSHSVSLIPYVGAKEFILENFKGSTDEPLPTASMSTQQPRGSSLTPQKQQLSATQLQKLLQLQRLKRMYDHHHYQQQQQAAYSSGNESSPSSAAALSSDSETDMYRRRPTPPTPSFVPIDPPSDELKRHQRANNNHNSNPSLKTKMGGSRTELEAGEVLASFFRRTQASGVAPRIPPPPSPTTTAPTPLPSILSLTTPTATMKKETQTLTLPPISSLSPPPISPPVKNPKHDLSFLLA